MTTSHPRHGSLRAAIANAASAGVQELVHEQRLHEYRWQSPHHSHSRRRYLLGRVNTFVLAGGADKVEVADGCHPA